MFFIKLQHFLRALYYYDTYYYYTIAYVYIEEKIKKIISRPFYKILNQLIWNLLVCSFLSLVLILDLMEAIFLNDKSLITEVYCI